jgi:hypothetical protein
MSGDAPGVTLHLEWRDRDARRIASLLEALVGADGTRVSGAPSWRFPLAGGTLIVTASDEDGRLDLDLEAGDSKADADAAGEAGGTLAAIGFATVDTDRAARSTGVATPATLRRDPILGAMAASLPLDGAPGVPLLLLEPDTESLMVTALARKGEGLRALWLALRPDRFAALPELVGDSKQLRGPALGPLGPEWMVVPARRWGPYLLLVAASGATQPLADTPYRSR